jgi:hypothetical protein
MGKSALHGPCFSASFGKGFVGLASAAFGAADRQDTASEQAPLPVRHITSNFQYPASVLFLSRRKLTSTPIQQTENLMCRYMNKVLVEITVQGFYLRLLGN